ncbi:MAG: nitroreductase family protein [Bacteroidota bacterium]
MHFSQLTQQRESTRKYLSDKPVEREKIEQIMQACQLAPSACNSQPWSFVVADHPDIKNKLADASYGPLLRFNKFVLQAPVIVAIVAEKPKWIAKVGGNIKNKDFYLIDIGIVAEHFCLQATDLGLGTCMLGWFDEKKTKQILGVPQKKRVILLITLGYPANDKIRKKIRKPMEQLFSYNQYRQE